MESSANPTPRSVIRPSQDCGLTMVCSSIHNDRYEGHARIALAADALDKKFPNFIFTERGEIIAIPGAGKLNWGFGLAGAEPVITGSDVLVTKGDKIGAIYTFLDPPKK